jgi:hypothetical protein
MTLKTSDELLDHSRTLDDIAISFRMLADELEKRNVDVLYADSLWSRWSVARCGSRTAL